MAYKPHVAGARQGLVALLALVALGCSQQPAAAPGAGTEVVLRGELDTHPIGADSARLFWRGAGNNQWLGAAKLVKKGTKASFTLPVRVPGPGHYVLTFSSFDELPLLLGTEPEVRIKTTGITPTKNPVFEGSRENTAFWAYTRQGVARAQRYQLAKSRLKGDSLRAAVADIWQRQLQDADSLRQSGLTILPILAATSAIPPYELATQPANYPIEQHFLDWLVAHDSLQSSVLGYLPQWYQKAQGFGQFVRRLGLPPDSVTARLEAILARLPQGSLTREAFLKGATEAVADDAQLVDLIGRRYLEEGATGKFAQVLEAQLKSQEHLRIGETAPEIALTTPEGTTVALSSLRGKYVLIDFWAAWCGPCRKENPHVVKLYNRFKTKGFEIYGVSLDEDKDAWVRAIRTDGLPWVQVSDLKGWQNSAAQRYNVKAIPATVLLGPDGQILAWNLRGEALTRTLERLLKD